MRDHKAMAALVLVAVCLWGAGPASAAEPRIVQTYRIAEAPTMIDVSATGGRIAVTTDLALRVLRLNANGAVGGLLRSLALRDLRVVRFTPNGRKIICADNNAQIHIVTCEDWSVTTLSSPRSWSAEAIDVCAQSREAYVLYHDPPILTAVNYHTERIVDDSEVIPHHGLDYPRRGTAVYATADGELVIPVLQQEDTVGAGGYVSAWECEGTDRTWRWACVTTQPLDLCPGPDDDHILIANHGTYAIRIARKADGVITSPSLFTDFEHPVGIRMSENGRWLVVVSLTESELRVLWGDDVRAALARELLPHEIRTASLSLTNAPAGVRLHPRGNVAYVWSAHGSCIDVVRLAIPGT